MIIDSNLIFTDGAVRKDSNSKAIALTSFSNPSRMGHIPINFRITESYDNLTSLSVTLQQADDENGTFDTVDDTSFSINLADLKAGKSYGWRCLPNNVNKSWLRLAYVIVGTDPTQGKVFAAITAEIDEPYTVDMHVKA